MLKRYVTFLLTALLLSACTATTPSAIDPARRAADIERDTDRAIESLQTNVEGADQLLSKARGVAIFPSVLSAALMVGGSRGDGVLRVNGQSVSYHTITSGSFGFQAGVRSAAMFLLFMTDESLQQFQSGKRDWSAGVDASVTVISAGLSAQATTTTLQQPVIGFVLANRGLMGGVSFDGSRIAPLNLQN
jgi:lipid-binding SYLF domain-containing protein